MKNIYNTTEWAELTAEIKHRKNTGVQLVFTNGCFDILHAGHEALLAYAKEQGGIVLVGLNSDSSVRRLKGKDRPINGRPNPGKES